MPCLSGHSLGAGTSVLLAFMLRPKYPDVKVYAFACPGKSRSYSYRKPNKNIGKFSPQKINGLTIDEI